MGAFETRMLVSFESRIQELQDLEATDDIAFMALEHNDLIDLKRSVWRIVNVTKKQEPKLRKLTFGISQLITNHFYQCLWYGKACEDVKVVPCPGGFRAALREPWPGWALGVAVSLSEDAAIVKAVQNLAQVRVGIITSEQFDLF